MKLVYLTLLISLGLTTELSAQNALQRAAHNIEYGYEAQISQSNGSTPFWLTANKHGMSSLDEGNGYMRAMVKRDVNTDSLSKWRIGYGADIQVAYNYTSSGFIQQLYADFDYKLVRLTIGAKEYDAQLKNGALSTGSQALGINARPVPAVRLELPEYWNITGKGNWAAIRGHISYGMQTDGDFRGDYVGRNNDYTSKILLHTKAGYLRLGNAKKFPLVFEGGLEMACQFGGTRHNVSYDGRVQKSYKLAHKFKDYVDATLGIGGDYGEGIYANATGNTVGSWMARLSWQANNWSVSAYYDHFFDDHSQMFFEYGKWKDGLIGVEVKLPKNRFVDNIVYEHMNATDQSGPIYHDHTPEIPDQISGRDNYYNHYIYVGWHNFGQAMGNPLYISPLYNHNNSLHFTSNIFKANHIGLSGTPTPWLAYRFLYTHIRSLGTMDKPFNEGYITNSVMAEVAFAPSHIRKVNTKGWTAKVAFGLDRGELIGNNTGFQFTISKTGLLKK